MTTVRRQLQIHFQIHISIQFGFGFNFLWMLFAIYNKPVLVQILCGVEQATVIWTNDGLFHSCMYASRSLDEFTQKLYGDTQLSNNSSVNNSHLVRRCRFTGIWIPSLNIKQSDDRLICTENPCTWKDGIHDKTGPVSHVLKISIHLAIHLLCVDNALNLQTGFRVNIKPPR